jgi:hypothetical protein
MRQNDMNRARNDADDVHDCCDCISLQRSSGNIAASYV